MSWVKYVSKYAQICRRPDLILMKCEVRFGDILADLNFWNVANEIDKVSALNLTLDGNDLFSGLWHCMRLCAFLDNRLRQNYAKMSFACLDFAGSFCQFLDKNTGNYYFLEASKRYMHIRVSHFYTFYELSLVLLATHAHGL